jgi:hydroxymethylpyrimidine/phosphomethylpyrimidine kinase
MPVPPVVLSIAGFDPSSGAGVTADIKTIAAHGCYGTACITALTVQSTRGVRQVIPLSADSLRSALEELASDLPPAAVHIGMLGAGEIAEVVAGFLEQSELSNVVLDPILRSSSGAGLLDETGLAVLRTRLLVRADVITPNLDEVAVLTGEKVCTLQGMALAADRLHELGARAVVIKGGHLNGPETVELLSFHKDGKLHRQEFWGPRLSTRATHGTGCAFASALACNLALKLALPEAVSAAKQYVAAAMKHAYPLGSGAGPMNHLYQLQDRSHKTEVGSQKSGKGTRGR